MKCQYCDESAIVHIRDIIVLYTEDNANPERILPDGKLVPLCNNHNRESKTTCAIIFNIE